MSDRAVDSEAGTGDSAGFRVDLPAYRGDLAGLTRALRGGSLTPADVDLRALVRSVLAWFEREAERDMDVASLALPQAARVIELKLRLMLPRAGATRDEEDEEDAAETLRAVALLEDLEGAITFLRRRRAERAVVVPVHTPRPDLPRPERPVAATAERLARLASRVRTEGYFEVTPERFTLAGAIRGLRRALGRHLRGTLRALHPARSWAERTVAFAAMLELVREGRVRAHQPEPYGEIQLEAVADADAGPAEGAPSDD